MIQVVYMPKVNKSALVPYSAEQMFNLVNDVEAYQSFLPGCKQSQVITQSDTHMQAKMVLAKAGIEQVLVTNNTLEFAKRIKMDLSDGPFKSLNGGWTFTEMSEEACKIELDLEFKFASRLVDMAFGKVFRDLTSKMVKAFSKRAREIY